MIPCDHGSVPRKRGSEVRPPPPPYPPKEREGTIVILQGKYGPGGQKVIYSLRGLYGLSSRRGARVGWIEVRSTQRAQYGSWELLQAILSPYMVGRSMDAMEPSYSGTSASSVSYSRSNQRNWFRISGVELSVANVQAGLPSPRLSLLYGGEFCFSRLNLGSIQITCKYSNRSRI